jgi:predicted nucleic acid-binding protein
MTATRGLLDTSVLIASETGRPLDAERLPDELALSAVTLAELHAGVLAARDVDARARRLATLESVADVEVLPVDAGVAAAWARLRVRLAETNRRMNADDLWIAATAEAHDVALVTQDDDFAALEGIAAVPVLRV